MRKLLAILVATVLFGACSSGGQATTAPPNSAPPVVGTPSPSASVAPVSEPPTTSATPTTPVEPTASSTSEPEPVAWTQLTPAGDAPSGREDHTWTVIDDGRALLFGGRTDNDATGELWAFDLASDTWTLLQPAGATPAARFGHTATWVPGAGLVIWSGQAGSRFFDDIWAYDPAADAWRQLPAAGDVPLARYGSCASLGPDGRLWISHGFTQDSGRFFDTRAYDFAAGTWSDETPDGAVPVERCLLDCYWSAGRLVLYAGQTTGVAALDDIWAFDPGSASWTRGPAANAPARQLYALADLGDGRALVVGGGSIEGGYLSDAWLIDTAGLELTELDQGQTVPSPRSGAALVVDPERGRVLLFGGQDDGGQLADLWELSGQL